MEDKEIYSEFDFFSENPSFFNKIIKKMKVKIKEIKKKSSAVKRKNLTKKKLPTPK